MPEFWIVAVKNIFRRYIWVHDINSKKREMDNLGQTGFSGWLALSLNEQQVDDLFEAKRRSQAYFVELRPSYQRGMKITVVTIVNQVMTQYLKSFVLLFSKLVS